MASNQTFVKISVTPVSVTLARFDELKAKVAEATRTVVEKGALVVATKAKQEFLSFPGGKRVSKQSGNTWYSFKAPYQAQPPRPTNRTGNLRASIDTQSVRQIGETRFEAKVGPKISYAPYVEFGTSTMQKEPFMHTALSGSLLELKSLHETEMAKVFE